MHYEASYNQFTPKLHALNQFQKFHYLLHVSVVGSLRPVTMVNQDVMDVASNHWVTLFDIEPSGVPTFQGGIQRYVDVFAGHPIPKLQVHAADHLGTAAPLLLQTEQVPEEVEVRKNTEKRLVEMDKDRNMQNGVGMQITEANHPKLHKIPQKGVDRKP